jgi:hypothetical protein
MAANNIPYNGITHRVAESPSVIIPSIISHIFLTEIFVGKKHPT